MKRTIAILLMCTVILTGCGTEQKEGEETGSTIVENDTQKEPEYIDGCLIQK